MPLSTCPHAHTHTHTNTHTNTHTRTHTHIHTLTHMNWSSEKKKQDKTLRGEQCQDAFGPVRVGQALRPTVACHATLHLADSLHSFAHGAHAGPKVHFKGAGPRTQTKYFP